MCNIKALSLLVQKLWSRLSFLKSRSKVKVKNFASNRKVLPQEIHVKYESPISFGSIVIAKVNIVKYFLKLIRSQGHGVKNLVST